MSIPMLCELAHSFPPRVAEFLERDLGKTRNFREETVTDLLMASLIGLEPFGIKVDFPDEPRTGGDMDWVFAAPFEIKGGRYLTVRLQAKRAQLAKRKKGDFWYYQHLDHGKGHQAKTLINKAKSSGGAAPILPLYILYHPHSALQPAAGKTPAVEGINLLFAHHVAPVVAGGCDIKAKKVDNWRGRFMPLSDILCWTAVIAPGGVVSDDSTQFLLDGGVLLPSVSITGGFHPDLVAKRLNQRIDEAADQSARSEVEPVRAAPANGIPAPIMRSIRGETTPEDRKALKRPRVILSTTLTSADSDLGFAGGLDQVRFNQGG